jgi:hypothetical protein
VIPCSYRPSAAAVATADAAAACRGATPPWLAVTLATALGIGLLAPAAHAQALAQTAASTAAQAASGAPAVAAQALQAEESNAAEEADEADDADADADERPPAARGPARRTAQPVLRQGIDDLLLEIGHLPDTPRADTLAHLRASAFVQWQPTRAWELRAGVRIDGQDQSGGSDTVNQWRADLGDTYVRWRGGDTRLTLGTQTVIWGRVDAVPLADRVSRVDLTRFLLDDLAQRRRSQLALRWEQSWEDTKLDLMLLPAFRGAALPALDSVWSPIDRNTGRVFGVAPTPELALLLRTARIDTDDGGGGGSGGAALRLTHDGEAVDIGLTLARTRQSLPYFRVDPFAPGGPLLSAVHPYNRFVGLDAEWTGRDITWRVELGHTDGVPGTRTDGSMLRSRAREAVAAIEFFPGGGDTRVSLMLVLRELSERGPMLELRRYAGVNGELATSLAGDRWRASLRFASGLNVHDLYLSPKIAFVGWEPHELYLAVHHFRGEARTLGGFHRDHGYAAVGWRTRF